MEEESEILVHLLELGFRVYAVGLSRPSEASDCHHDNKCIFIHADLADFSGVELAAQQIVQAESSVDLLICNAGVMFHPDPYIATKNGFIERHLGVNLMSHALLFSKLLPALEMVSSSNGYSCPDAKAVFLSSATCHAGDLTHFLQGTDEDAWSYRLNAYKSYADSKLLIALYVNELSRRLAAKSCPVTVVSVHPGVIPGSLYRHVIKPLRFLIIHVLQRILRSGSDGAEQVLNLALTQATELVPGAYYEEGTAVNVAQAYTRSQASFLFDETNRRLEIKCY
ncbi:oxidoreductaseshort chain dehydrogenase/reductase family protein [Aphelenchoides avenae]|nr:oxidoreductaseshort chain dehydrogenase/reductase family protein [Aphelenchus avenae]